MQARSIGSLPIVDSIWAPRLRLTMLHPTEAERWGRSYAGVSTRNFWRISKSPPVGGDDWDPQTLHSPIQHLVPPPTTTTLDNNVPFGEGRDLIVNIDVNPKGRNDMFVNDIIPLTVGLPGTDNMLHATTQRVTKTIPHHVSPQRVAKS